MGKRWLKFLKKAKIIHDGATTRTVRARRWMKDDPERPWRYKSDGKTKYYLDF